MLRLSLLSLLLGLLAYLLLVPACTLGGVTDAPEREAGETPGQALRWYRETLVDARGQIPHDALRRAMDHRANLAALEFGTAGIERGSWEWQGPGNIGGRIRGMWIQPYNSRVMLIGSASGGIWRTENGGASWFPIDDYPASMPIGCMAGPLNSKNEVWAGTGEGFGNYDAVKGGGIYRSLDGGKTFTLLPSTLVNDFDYVTRIAFSPTDANRVLVSTMEGVFLSTNGGASWTKVRHGHYLDVKFHPSNGNYALCGGKSHFNFYVSKDGGSSWSSVNGISLPSGSTYSTRVELAYARFNGNIAYAAIARHEQPGLFFRSGDAGQNWTGPYVVDPNGRDTNWYNSVIWAGHNDPDVVVLGGVDLFKSTDGGKTFAPNANIHADNHVVLHDPAYNGTSNRRVFVCNDGGVYRTNDILSASTSGGWTALNNRLGITQFYGGDVLASGFPFGGTQDNGTLKLQSATTKAFTSVNGSDGMQCEADPTDPNFLVGEIQDARVFRSLDGGKTVQSIVNNITDAGSKKAPWIGALCMDPNNPNRVWLGSFNLWKTETAKTTNPKSVVWTVEMTSDTNPFRSVDVAEGNSNVVVAARDTWPVMVTKNALAATPKWTQKGQGLPKYTPSKVRISPRNLNHIYVTFYGYHSDGIYFSPDFGDTWHDISGKGATGLPTAPVRALVLHPHNEGWIYVGTEVGVFSSTDNGQTWTTSNAGPANVPVNELRFWHEYIFAFTHGRGIYRGVASTPQDLLARTSRASLGWNEQQSDDHSSGASISGSGRFVAFESTATNLVSGDNNGRRDIFVRDRQAGNTTRVSLSTGRSEANQHCYDPSISDDGRFVAFHSGADNLVGGDTNQRLDIFVHDRSAGTTERVSVSSAGAEANGNSTLPSISADGRYVVFVSSATNLVPNDTNSKTDVFRFDRVTRTCIRVSLSDSGAELNAGSTLGRRVISADGQRIVFSTAATNLVPRDPNGKSDVFLRDLGSGRSASTSLLTPGLAAVTAGGDSLHACISADGQRVVFASEAPDLVSGDSNGRWDIFLCEILRSGNQLSLLSKPAGGGQSNNHSNLPVLAADGQSVVFASDASNLVPDTNGASDVFFCNLSAGSIQRLSVDPDGREASGPSFAPMPSRDGLFVAFGSDAPNLVTDDSNGARDIFVGVAGLDTTVYPVKATNTEQPASSDEPFATDDLRLQVVSRESKGTLRTIQRLSFRRDGGAAVPSASKRGITLELDMGGGDVDQLGSSFVQNYVLAPTQVITRKLFHLPERSGPAGRQPFDLSLPLDTPYTHSGLHHLIWDMQVWGNTKTTPYPVDTWQNSIGTQSTSLILGPGCTTPNGPMNHSFTLVRQGKLSTLNMGISAAPASAGCMIAIGVNNPDFLIPGWCARLYTDAAIVAPIGNTDRNGAVSVQLTNIPWKRGYAGLQLYTQGFTPAGGGLLSNGRRVTMPQASPNPLLRSLRSRVPRASTGLLLDEAPVFRLEY